MNNIIEFLKDYKKIFIIIGVLIIILITVIWKKSKEENVEEVPSQSPSISTVDEATFDPFADQYTMDDITIESFEEEP